VVLRPADHFDFCRIIFPTQYIDVPPEHPRALINARWSPAAWDADAVYREDCRLVPLTTMSISRDPHREHTSLSLRGDDLAPTGRMELGNDADNVRIDTPRNRVLVGYRRPLREAQTKTD
jgi:hypothetical protein